MTATEIIAGDVHHDWRIPYQVSGLGRPTGPRFSHHNIYCSIGMLNPPELRPPFSSSRRVLPSMRFHSVPQPYLTPPSRRQTGTHADVAYLCVCVGVFVCVRGARGVAGEGRESICQ